MLLSRNIASFGGVCDCLSLLDGLALMNYRPVIPKACRREILKNLHSAHQGVSGMTARAHQTIYWPGLDSDMGQHLRQVSISSTANH